MVIENERIIDVNSKEGFYDIEATRLKAVKGHGFPLFCFGKHKWTHNILTYTDSGSRQRVSYVRKCEHCGTVDCVHELDDEMHYRITRNNYYSIHFFVAYCRRCHRRVCTNGYDSVSSNDKAKQLISETTEELGCNVYFGFDFDTIVSQMLDRDGIDATRHYIINALQQKRFHLNKMET